MGARRLLWPSSSRLWPVFGQVEDAGAAKQSRFLGGAVSASQDRSGDPFARRAVLVLPGPLASALALSAPLVAGTLRFFASRFDRFAFCR